MGDDDDDDDNEETAKAKARKDKEAEDDEAVGTVEKQKNWSSVNVAFKESKLNFRGVLSTQAFTNWLWHRCVRVRLEDTKAVKLSEVDTSALGIDDVEEIMGEYVPAPKVDKDKKDKKEKDDKKDKKDEKKAPDPKNAKDNKK